MTDEKTNLEEPTELPDYDEQEQEAMAEVSTGVQKFVPYHKSGVLSFFVVVVVFTVFFFPAVALVVYRGTHVAMNSTGWKDFMLNPLLFRAISDCGFEHPSEVQHAVIPQAILGTDVICQAKSGMGKTAVFVISVIQQNPEPKVCTNHHHRLADQCLGTIPR